MRGYLAVKYINTAVGKKRAQMVVGPPVAKSKLKYVPLNTADKIRRAFETSALSDKAANRTVESAHNLSSSKFRCEFDVGRTWLARNAIRAT
jgi:hypothetical protein